MTDRHKHKKEDDLDRPIKRGYSPIGLTFTSNHADEPCEPEVVRSIKIVSAGPNDPIPASEGYDLAYIVPNATLSESAGQPPLHLGESATVYVFVKFGEPG